MRMILMTLIVILACISDSFLAVSSEQFEPGDKVRKIYVTPPVEIGRPSKVIGWC